MKWVDYLGCVSFAIPDNWIEDADTEAETSVFYDPASDTGFLGLYVEAARAPRPATSEMVAELMAAFAPEATNPVELLPNGNLLLRMPKDVLEEDPSLAVFAWMVGNLVPPDHARFAYFSYNVDVDQADLPAAQAAIAFFDQSIRSAIFAPV